MLWDELQPNSPGLLLQAQTSTVYDPELSDMQPDSIDPSNATAIRVQYRVTLVTKKIISNEFS